MDLWIGISTQNYPNHGNLWLIKKTLRLGIEPRSPARQAGIFSTRLSEHPYSVGFQLG
mgnify:CR=1 FL=1